VNLLALLRRAWSRTRSTEGARSEPALPMLDEIRKLAGPLQSTWGPTIRDLRTEGVLLNLDDDGSDDDDSADDAEDDDSDDDADDQDDDPDSDVDDQDDGSDDDSDVDDDDEDELTPKQRKEYHRLKREAADRAKKDKQDKRKRAEETGKWKEHATDAEKERDDAVEAKEQAEAELSTFKRNLTVSRIAGKLKFNDPDDAHKFLPESAADGNDAQVEKALRKVLKEKPYLKAEGGSRKTKARSGGDDDDSSEPDLDSMTPAEIREWEKTL
jgi:hypothetical protein